MIAFVLDRVVFATHADLKDVNLIGHGIRHVINVSPVQWQVGPGPAAAGQPVTVQDLPINPTAPSKEEVQALCDAIADTVRKGGRVAIAEAGQHCLAPVVCTAYLALFGHSWDDAWDAMTRVCNSVARNDSFHHHVRLAARELWASLR